MSGSFRIYDAVPAAARIAYLAAKILVNEMTPIAYYKGQDIRSWNIVDQNWNFLNKLKKQLQDDSCIPLAINERLPYDDINIETVRLNAIDLKKLWAKGLQAFYIPSKNKMFLMTRPTFQDEQKSFYPEVGSEEKIVISSLASGHNNGIAVPDHTPFPSLALAFPFRDSCQGTYRSSAEAGS